MNDRHKLVWGQSPVSLPMLPPQITRSYVSTPHGKLELLSAQPSSSQPRKKALLFQHGGFGTASVWIPFLAFFSAQGFPCYALSLRGRGGSWRPGYFRMVWMTGLASLAEDLAYAFKWIKDFESERRESMTSEDVVLIGHSSGGGLSQYFLDRQLGQVGGLIILAGVPCFGNFGVYTNWFRLDPWFAPRYYIRDFWHPRSPLSSTRLVHRAFFSSSFPVFGVQEFELAMPEYESMLWPLQMMIPFVKVQNVLRNILGWKASQSRLMVIAGENDKLMGVRLMEKMAAIYRLAIARMVQQLLPGHPPPIPESKLPGVEFAVIRESGHHVQNDLHWEECAKEILGFLQQL